jgi:hypothetical protein
MYAKPPSGGPTLALNANSQIVLEGGDLAAPVTASLALVGNKAIIVNNTNRISLAFNPTSGTFQGSFTPPKTRATVSLNGVAIQPQHQTLGLFLGRTRSGGVRMK